MTESRITSYNVCYTKLLRAMQGVQGNTTMIASRIYGIGGKEFFVEDAEAMLREALEIAESYNFV